MKPITMVMISLLMGCQTTTEKVEVTHVYRCTDENPYKDGACTWKAAFLDPFDCIRFLTVDPNKDGEYTMCSYPAPKK